MLLRDLLNIPGMHIWPLTVIADNIFVANFPIGRIKYVFIPVHCITMGGPILMRRVLMLGVIRAVVSVGKSIGLTI